MSEVFIFHCVAPMYLSLSLHFHLTTFFYYQRLQTALIFDMSQSYLITDSL